MTVRDIRNAIDGLADDSLVVLAVQMEDGDCQPYIELLAAESDGGALAIHVEYISGCECDDFDDMDDEDEDDEDKDDDLDEDF
jgi:hypothetical protein